MERRYRDLHAYLFLLYLLIQNELRLQIKVSTVKSISQSKHIQKMMIFADFNRHIYYSHISDFIIYHTDTVRIYLY